jgi:hypothetical protein
MYGDIPLLLSHFQETAYNEAFWHGGCIFTDGNMRSVRTKPHGKIGQCWLPASKRLPKTYLPIITFTALVLCGTAFPATATKPLTAGAAANSAIVIGFVGGFVHSNDIRHAEVQLAEKLRTGYSGHAHVSIFGNHHRDDAYNAVMKWLDSDGNGGISDSERRQARIILYGHSWGASAVVALARELQKQRIPILLTIQVDSITKPGQDDRVIPPNVARAVNFYQAGGMLHGLPEIVPADPLRTQILGDFRFDYKKQPEPCSTYPWFARHFLKGHTAIECDPNVWSRIETLIDEYLLPAQNQDRSSLPASF